jgi:hypothetical protein
MNLLKSFPDLEQMLQNSSDKRTLYNINAHIHSPYSFSAFEDLSQAFDLAHKEKINILGINDFFLTDGYREFYDFALKSKIFPLFNIEFIALSVDLQKAGIRVNDPNNPGRIYFSGKGLDFPISLPENYQRVVNSFISESQLQVRAMVDKTNAWLEEINADFKLDFQSVKTKYAKNLVRERHIAKALREEIFNSYPTHEARKDILMKLFSGSELSSDIDNKASVENEIRNRILKAGGKAFVEEDEKAFLNLESVMDIIYHAGGVPCYPVLLDDSKGNITEFERNKENLLTELSEKNISCIELIPVRNDFAVMKDFVEFFYKNGFLVLFGTEHNTPELSPLTVSCRNHTPLDQTLLEIGNEAALAIAAHQYLRSKGMKSKVPHWNSLLPKEKEQLIKLGKSVVERFINV